MQLLLSTNETGPVRERERETQFGSSYHSNGGSLRDQIIKMSATAPATRQQHRLEMGLNLTTLSLSLFLSFSAGLVAPQMKVKSGRALLSFLVNLRPTQIIHGCNISSHKPPSLFVALMKMKMLEAAEKRSEI